MDDMRLQNPVAIAVGAGFRRDITMLAEMRNFLQEWPHARRGKICETALRACEMARAGYVTKDQALRAFTAFTETAGIAWTGIDPVTALRLAKAGTGRPRSTL